GHPRGGIAEATQDAPLAAQHELALAIGALLDDGRGMAGEDRGQRFIGRGAVVRDAEKPRHVVPLLVERIEVAHPFNLTRLFRPTRRSLALSPAASLPELLPSCWLRDSASNPGTPWPYERNIAHRG